MKSTKQDVSQHTSNAPHLVPHGTGITQNWGAETLRLTAVLIPLTVLMTWPLAARFCSHLPGPVSQTDTPVYYWNFWWFRAGLGHWFPNPFSGADVILYPLGTQLAYHTTTYYYAILSLPATWLLGDVAAYNMVCLSTFVTAAIASYWLARYLGLKRTTAWLVALLFAFSPFRMKCLTQHLCFMQGDMFAIYLLGLAMLMDRERRWWVAACLCGISVAGAFYCDLTSAIYLTMISVIFVLMFLRPWSNLALSTRVVIGLGTAACIATVLCAPLLTEIYRVHRTGDYYVGTGWLRYSADLVGFVTPPRGSLVWDALRGGGPSYKCRQVGVTFFGFLPLLLFSLAFFKGSTSQWMRFLKVTLVVFWVLSLGPFLKMFGEKIMLESASSDGPFGLPLPFVFLAYLPILSNARGPARFHQVTTLVFALLVGVGFELLTRLRVFKRFRIPAAIVVMVVSMAEYAIVPIATFQPVLDVFDVVRDDPDDVVVLDDKLNGREAILHQVRHEKVIATGVVSRIPPECYGYLTSAPLLREFSAKHATAEHVAQYRETPGNVTMTRNIVDLLGIRYFVINGPEEAYKRRLFDGAIPYDLVGEAGGTQVFRLAATNHSGLRPERIAVGQREWSAYLAHGWGQWNRKLERHGNRFAIWPRSPMASVLFRVDSPGGMRAEFDTFLPSSCTGVRMEVSINGNTLGTIDVPSGIATLRVRIAESIVKKGLNEATFRWPYPQNKYVWREGAHVEPAMVLSSGGSAGPFVRGEVQIRGRGLYKNSRGYNIVELSTNGRRVLRTNTWDPYTDKDAWKKLVEHIDSIPKGRLVAFLSAGEASHNMTEDAVEALGDLGSCFDMRDRHSWCHAGLGLKGMKPGEAIEAASGQSAISFAPGRCGFIEFRFYDQ